MAQAPAPSEPIPVYTGPTRTGAALIAAVAADTRRGRKAARKESAIAAKKPDAAGQKNEAKPDGNKSDGKHEVKQASKPAAAKHAAVKPDAAAKPATGAAADKPAPKPSKPKASTSSTAAPAAAAPKAVAKQKNETKQAS
jgi:D-alanyl-D-alanine carboxypeptidase